MSKNIKSSLSRFNNENRPLGKRQGGGSMPKRISQGIEHSAMRLRHTPFVLGGIVGSHARRGFDYCNDTGVERERLYCRLCGTMAKSDDDKCRICDARFVNDICAMLSPDKFDLKCIACDRYFHVKERIKTDVNLDKWIIKRGKSKELKYDIRFDAKKASGDNLPDIIDFRVGDREYQICDCYLDAKKKYVADLRRERENRKIYLASKNKVTKSERLTALKFELSNLESELVLIATELSRTKLRFEKKQITFRRAGILKRITELKNQIG